MIFLQIEEGFIKLIRHCQFSVHMCGWDGEKGDVWAGQETERGS
jgi:hypothetical protein